MRVSFFFSSRRRHTRCALVTGVQTCALPIYPWIAALFALAAWVGITGALHLDGLSDLADARGAAHGDRDKLLTVLADPHVGSFGVTVIVLQLLAKAVLLHATVQVSLPALIDRKSTRLNSSH